MQYSFLRDLRLPLDIVLIILVFHTRASKQIVVQESQLPIPTSFLTMFRPPLRIVRAFADMLRVYHL